MLGFTTDRLVIEDWTPHLGDKERRSSLEHTLTEILTPIVLRHLPEPLQRTGASDVSNWINARAKESDVFLIHRQDTKALIGLLILATFDGDPPIIHIGYLFHQHAWGEGFATELLRGLVAHMMGPARLLAGVEPDNPASARVLEKTGFTKAAAGIHYTLELD